MPLLRGNGGGMLLLGRPPRTASLDLTLSMVSALSLAGLRHVPGS